MPKKATTPRSSAQRQKPKAQKSFELVRPVSEDGENELENNAASSQVESLPQQVAALPKKSARVATSSVSVAEKELVESKSAAPILSAPKGSAAARMAARRQGSQRVQRNASALVTAEHFTYVIKDLIFIAILAIIMIIAIIVLYFIFGKGL